MDIKHRSRWKLIIVWFLAAVSVLLFVAETAHATGDKIVILPFEALSVDKDIADKAGLFLRQEISNDKLGEIIEPSLVDKAMAALNMPSCANRECALQLLKELKADKLVYAKMLKITRHEKDQAKDQISIEAFLVIKTPWEFEKDHYAIQENSNSKYYRPLVATITHINVKHSDVTETGYQFAHNGISMHVAWANPMGAFSDLAKNGYGINASFTAHSFKVKSETINWAIQGGYYYFYGNSDNINYITLLPLGMALRYNKYFLSMYMLGLTAGAGYQVATMSYTTTSDAERSYSTKYYYDPYVTVGISVGIRALGDAVFKFEPTYVYFFEKNNNGAMLLWNIGIRYSL